MSRPRLTQERQTIRISASSGMARCQNWLAADLHALSIQVSESVKILRPCVDLPQAQAQLLTLPPSKALKAWPRFNQLPVLPRSRARAWRPCSPLPALPRPRARAWLPWNQLPALPQYRVRAWPPQSPLPVQLLRAQQFPQLVNNSRLHLRVLLPLHRPPRQQPLRPLHPRLPAQLKLHRQLALLSQS
jgi:hypothetical protein